MSKITSKILLSIIISAGVIGTCQSDTRRAPAARSSVDASTEKLIPKEMITHEIKKQFQGTPSVVTKIDRVLSAELALSEMEDPKGINDKIQESLNASDDLISEIINLQDFTIETTGTERKKFLQSRMRVNKQRSNTKAVTRDNVELHGIYNNEKLTRFLVFITKSRAQLTPIEIVSNQIKQEAKWVEETTKWATTIKNELSETETEIAKTTQLNLNDLSVYLNTYERILHTAGSNASLFGGNSLSSYMQIGNIITTLNQTRSGKSFNRSLGFFNLDYGRLIIFFTIIAAFFILVPIANKGFKHLLHHYSQSEEDHVVIREISRPFRWLLIYLGVDLALMAGFHNTENQLKLENIIYSGYILMFLWGSLKVIDFIFSVIIDRITSTQKKLREELINAGIRVVKFLVILVFAIFTLSHFGISITAILSTLGLGGLAVALAAKETLSNLFGSFAILADDMLRQGEWVDVDGVEGDVIEIGMRSTTLRTFDNAMITIPNSKIVTSTVKNWSRRQVGRRIKMRIGVSKESSSAAVRESIKDIRQMLVEHTGIANTSIENTQRRYRAKKVVSAENLHGVKNTLLVYLDELTPHSMDILIYCFSRTTSWAQWLEIKQDVLFKIKDILDENKVEMAYPTETRYHKKILNQPQEST